MPSGLGRTVVHVDWAHCPESTPRPEQASPGFLPKQASTSAGGISARAVEGKEAKASAAKASAKSAEEERSVSIRASEAELGENCKGGDI